MRIGLFLLAAQFPGQTHTEVLDRTFAAAVTAERAGFAGVWLAEHHFMSYGVCPSVPLVPRPLTGPPVVVACTSTAPLARSGPRRICPDR